MQRQRTHSPVFRAIVVVALVTAVGGGARFWNLSQPGEKVFDETYYASDGCLYAGVSFGDCDLEADAERSWVHPPLGKFLISWGVDGFGNRPLGWRFSAAASGTLTIALVGALAFLLTRKPLWAGVASLLIATEHLVFVQSRVAMLDIFLAMFVVLGFLLLVLDRVRRDRRDAEEARGDPPPLPVVAGGAGTEVQPEIPPLEVEARGGRPVGRSGPRAIRVAAGGALAAATAVKWSGVFALAGGVVLALMWERGRRRRAGYGRPFLGALREEGASLALAFVVAPLAVYAVTWTGWLADNGWSVSAWWSNHVAIADYHLGLDTLTDEGEPIHPYMSRASTWFFLGRPVAYFFQRGQGSAAEILAIGNPLLFWGALLFLPILAVAWIARRDWRAGAVLVPVLFQYVPWLFVSRPLFLFYMTPVAPFLAIGATLVLRDVARLRVRGRRLFAGVAGALVAVGVGVFVFFWPVLVGNSVGLDAWRSRIWFSGWI